MINNRTWSQETLMLQLPRNESEEKNEKFSVPINMIILFKTPVVPTGVFKVLLCVYIYLEDFFNS